MSSDLCQDLSESLSFINIRKATQSGTQPGAALFVMQKAMNKLKLDVRRSELYTRQNILTFLI